MDIKNLQTNSNGIDTAYDDNMDRYQKCALCRILIPIDQAEAHSSECFDEMLLKKKRERHAANRVTVISDEDDEIPLLTKKTRRQTVMIREDQKKCPFCNNQFDAVTFVKHTSSCSGRKYLEIKYMRMISFDHSPTYAVADFERRRCIICERMFIDSASKVMHDQDCLNAFLLHHKDLFNRSDHSLVMNTLRHILGLIQRTPFYMPDGTMLTHHHIMCNVFSTGQSAPSEFYHYIDEDQVSEFGKAISRVKGENIDVLSLLLDKSLENSEFFLICVLIDAISMILMDTKQKLDSLYAIDKPRSIRNNILNALWYNMERKISGDPYTIFNMLELCLIERNTFLLYEIIMSSSLFSYECMTDTISMLREDYKYLYRLISFCPKIQEKYKQHQV